MIIIFYVPFKVEGHDQPINKTSERLTFVAYQPSVWMSVSDLIQIKNVGVN